MLFEHWSKQPPTHRLLAMFLEYKGAGSTEAKPSGQGFEITPSMTAAFGNPCRQSLLHPHIKKTVEEMQSTPAYKKWREKIAGRVNS